MAENEWVPRSGRTKRSRAAALVTVLPIMILFGGARLLNAAPRDDRPAAGSSSQPDADAPPTGMADGPAAAPPAVVTPAPELAAPPGPAPTGSGDAPAAAGAAPSPPLGASPSSSPSNPVPPAAPAAASPPAPPPFPPPPATSAAGARGPSDLALPAAPPAPMVVGVAPPASLVQSRVYGFLNVQLERSWAKGGATPYDPRFRVVDGGSRIGYAGAVAVATDTSALWQLEGALAGFEQGGLTDQGAHTSIVSRNSFVGVENRRFGRLVAGNNDSAYRRLVGSGGDMGGNLGLTVLGLDLWNNTSAQFSGNGKSIFGRGEERYHNSIHYVSPAFPVSHQRSSIQVAASFETDQALVQSARRDRFSVAGLYRIGAFSLGAAFDRQANTGVDVDTLEQGFGLRTDALNGVATYYYEVLASYRFPFGTYLGAGVERSNYGFLLLVPPTSGFYAGFNRGVMRQTGAMASIAQPIGRATLMASAGLLSDLSNAFYGSGSDYRTAQFSLGAKYAFTDRFGAYVVFTGIQNRSQQDVNLGAPIYSNNLGTAQAYLAPGDKPRSIGFGALVRF